MKICASVAVKSLKEARKLEPLFKLLENVPLELNITGIVRGPDFEKFIPLLAVELEDLVQVDQVQYIRVSTEPQRGIVERVLTLLDYLNVERLVLPRPEPVDTDLMFNIVDEASRYGIKVVWKFPKIESLDTLNEIANELAPYRLRIAADIHVRKSYRKFARKFIEASGYIYVTYFYNRTERELGLPIFHERGLVNYVKIAKILTCIKYEGDIVLRYRPEYYGHYRSDIDLLSTILASVGSQAIDEKTLRFVESVLREAVGWSIEDLSYLRSVGGESQDKSGQT